MNYIFKHDGLHPLDNQGNPDITTFVLGELDEGVTVVIGHHTPSGWSPFGNGSLGSFGTVTISHGHGAQLAVLVVNHAGNDILLETRVQGVPDHGEVLNNILTQVSTPIKTEAPVGGHWRNDGVWVLDPIQEDAPADGTPYLRVNNAEGTPYWAPLTNLKLTKQSIGTFSTTESQAPSSEGAGGAIIVHFGEGGDTTGGEFSISPDGDILCNQNSQQYSIDIAFRFQRQGANGVSHLVGRMVYASDGINFGQIGDTFGIEVDDADTVWREAFNLTFSPMVGSIIRFEFARDALSSNSGELGTFQPTGDLTSWRPIPSASLEISKSVLTI